MQQQGLVPHSGVLGPQRIADAAVYAESAFQSLRTLVVDMIVREQEYVSTADPISLLMSLKNSLQSYSICLECIMTSPMMKTDTVSDCRHKGFGRGISYRNCACSAVQSHMADRKSVSFLSTDKYRDLFCHG